MNTLLNNNLLKFLNQVSSDTKLMSEFFANKSSEDMYKFALSHSEGGFSQQELQDSLDMMEVCAAKLKKGELSESNLENVAGGGHKIITMENGAQVLAVDSESTLRSIAMLATPLVSLLVNGGQLLSNYFEAKSRYNNQQDKLRIQELEERLDELEKLKTVPSE